MNKQRIEDVNTNGEKIKMNRAQFCKKLKALDDKHKLAKEKLALQCAKSNSIANPGDIIDNGSDRIEVETIDVCWSATTNLPACTYSGPKLTNAGVKWANGKYTSIHQYNVRKINGETVKR